MCSGDWSSYVCSSEFQHPPQPHVAALGVDLRADVVLGAIARAGGALDRILHRLDHDVAVDQLFTRDRICNREQLGLVGGNCCGHVSAILPSEFDRRRPWKAEQSRSEEHTSELQSLMRISYAAFCLKK